MKLIERLLFFKLNQQQFTKFHLKNYLGTLEGNETQYDHIFFLHKLKIVPYELSI